MMRLRLLMERLLLDALPGSRINAADVARLPGCTSILFGDLRGSDVLGAARCVAASTTSACSSGGSSHVLRAIGLTPDEADRVIRLGVGRPTTERTVRRAVTALSRAYRSLNTRPKRGTGPAHLTGAR